MLPRRPRRLLVLLGGTLVAAAGCRSEMYDQPRYDPLEASTFFDDGKSARHPPAGTVPREARPAIPALRTGRTAGGLLASEFPMDVDLAFLRRGRERYEIFCSPCHALVGSGDGMIVRRGFPEPPSFHIPRLRQQPPGYFVEVMTEGFGAMPSYASVVEPRERWAITAYIQALQLSQNAPPDLVPSDVQQELEETQP